MKLIELSELINNLIKNNPETAELNVIAYDDDFMVAESILEPYKAKLITIDDTQQDVVLANPKSVKSEIDALCKANRLYTMSDVVVLFKNN